MSAEIKSAAIATESSTATASTSPTLILVDGHSLAFRSYYAFANSREGGLRTSTGIPTSVCFGFTKALLDTIAAEKPEYLAVAFDTRQPTFRHEADETYKDGRPETPEDFIEDIQNLQELLKGFNFPVVTAPGFEADDVLGTMADRAAADGFKVKILSGDRDLFQLIDDDRGISVLYLGGRDMRSSRYKSYRSAEVVERWGVSPDQVIDFKALCGDKSDNIPGVKGIGEKTAAKLLQAHQTLDGIYEALEQLKPAARKKLEGDREAAYHSQFLAKIVVDAPVEVELKQCKLDGFEREAVSPMLTKLEFQRFLRDIEKLQGQLGGTPIPPPEPKAKSSKSSGDSGQMSFFPPAKAQPEHPKLNLSTDIAVDVINTPEALAELVGQLQACESAVSWDTETTGLDPFAVDLVGIGCCFELPDSTGEDGKPVLRTAYIPVGHTEGEQLVKEAVLEGLRSVLEAGDRPKIFQNAKFDRNIFRAQGIELDGVVFDTMLASYILNPDRSHNLTDLSFRYLGYTPESYKDLVPRGKTIADVPIDAASHYCGMDVYGAFHLMPLLKEELSAFSDLKTLYQDVELPTEPILAEMEFAGIRIDTDYLGVFSKQLESDLDRIESDAYKAAGETFNLGSPKQLSELLFEKLGLDRKKSRKIKTGYSTDAKTLERLKDDHEVVSSIVEYRTLAKLKSTYVDALPALVKEKTARVHTDFNQAVTTTGRLSSSNPNLQNIPIRTEFSRQIRRAFIPQESWMLAAADYSQIELRILAHLSQEDVLIDAYQTGRDVHSLTAQLLLDKEDISSDERRLGKIINFGVIYGMGAVRFAREAKVSKQDARMFIDRFNQRYPNAFEYLQMVQKEAIAQGYVTTLLGRRRYFNFSSSNLQRLRGTDPAAIDLRRLKIYGQGDAQALRAAANAPIQGSSADIIKLAMIEVQKVLEDYQARLLLQVHDELIFEMPPEEWTELEGKIKHAMESVIDISVPLEVEIHSGNNWMEAK
ncbi:MAG: DNA polymerase I [Cyanobacteria bacterium P01_D01_bin.73]